MALLITKGKERKRRKGRGGRPHPQWCLTRAEGGSSGGGRSRGGGNAPECDKAEHSGRVLLKVSCVSTIKPKCSRRRGKKEGFSENRHRQILHRIASNAAVVYFDQHTEICNLARNVGQNVSVFCQICPCLPLSSRGSIGLFPSLIRPYLPLPQPPPPSCMFLHLTSYPWGLQNVDLKEKGRDDGRRNGHMWLSP